MSTGHNIQGEVLVIAHIHTHTQFKKSYKDTEEASHWCVRYLPFSLFIKQPGKKAHHDLHECTLSVLSELPNTSLLADQLALFSATCFNENVPNLEGKHNRILSRLRSSKDEENSQPLSVRYQTKSQLIVSHIEQRFGKSLGKFCELVQICDTGVEDASLQVHKKALKVGNILYEYDSEYLNFLDTLFSVIVPLAADDHLSHFTKNSSDSSGLVERHLKAPSTPKVGTCTEPPYLSDFLSMFKDVEVKAHPWQCVLPLLETLHSWSQKASPQVNPDLQRETKFRHRKSKEASKKAMFKQTSLKVSLPPELLISCLKERELVQEKSTGSIVSYLPKKEEDGPILPCLHKEEDHRSILPCLPNEEDGRSILPCLRNEEGDGSTKPYVPDLHSETFKNSLSRENLSCAILKQSQSSIAKDGYVDPVDILQTEQPTSTPSKSVLDDSERLSLITIPGGVLKVSCFDVIDITLY